MIFMEVTLVYVLLFMVIALAILAGVLAYLSSKIKNRWDASSIYNVAACLIVASIMVGALSLIAVWVALPDGKEVDFTHQDVIVDILAILVTVLMGWNIISVVDIKKKADEVDRITGDLEKVISGIIQMSIHSFTLRPDKEAVIHSCFMSLEKILDCKNEFVRKTAIKEIMKVLHQVKCTYQNGEQANIFRDSEDRYNSILWAVDDEYKEEIVNMVRNANVLNSNEETISFAAGGQNAGNVNREASEVDYNPNQR